MAHSKTTLMHCIRGSSHKLTFYTLNTQPVIRRKAKFIANPRSSKQQANRCNMPFLIYAFRKLRPLLISSMNNRSKTRSAYNEFLSRNLNHSMVGGKFLPWQFRVSTDDIPGTGFTVLRMAEPSNKFNIKWDKARTGNQHREDLLCAVVFTPVNYKFHYKITEITREEESTELTFNLNFHTVSGFLYLFFVRKDFAQSSFSSVYKFDAIN